MQQMPNLGEFSTNNNDQDETVVSLDLTMASSGDP